MALHGHNDYELITRVCQKARNTNLKKKKFEHMEWQYKQGVIITKVDEN